MKGFFTLVGIVNIVIDLLLLVAIITVAIVSSTLHTSPAAIVGGFNLSMSRISQLEAEAQNNMS